MSTDVTLVAQSLERSNLGQNFGSSDSEQFQVFGRLTIINQHNQLYLHLLFSPINLRLTSQPLL